jgi:hypothetical protein
VRGERGRAFSLSLCRDIPICAYPSDSATSRRYGSGSPWAARRST